MEQHSRGCRGPSGGRFLARGKRSCSRWARDTAVRGRPGRCRARAFRLSGRSGRALVVAQRPSSRAPVALDARRNSVHRCTSSFSSICAGRAGQGRERAQEAAVGLVLPRDRPLAAPAGPAQRVEPAVVAGAGVGVRRDVAVVGQGVLGEHRPGQAGRRVGGRHVLGAQPVRQRVGGGVLGQVGRGDAEQVGAHGGPPGRSGMVQDCCLESREHAVRGRPRTACSLLSTAGVGGVRQGQPWWVPAERRFWQASTTRAAMPASASLPQARGSYCFLLPTSPSIFSTPA